MWLFIYLYEKIRIKQWNMLTRDSGSWDHSLPELCQSSRRTLHIRVSNFFFFFFMAETSFFPPYKLNVEPNGEILTYSHLPSPISPNTMIQSQVSTGGTPWTQCDPVSTIWKSLISHSRFNTFPIVSLIPKSNDIDDIV